MSQPATEGRIRTPRPVHKSVLQALAFSTEAPEKYAIPTDEDCRRFVAWHSRGQSYNPLTPGLLRLVRGFKNMGLCLGRDTNEESWAYNFKDGILFLSDFMDNETPDIQRVMAFETYRRTLGSIPTCYLGC